MPARSPEDIIQRVFDEVAGGIRIAIDGALNLASNATLTAILDWLDARRQEIIDIVPLALQTLFADAREHQELTSVPSVYNLTQCTLVFTRQVVRIDIFATQDVFWIDSPLNDTDAQTRLTTPGLRGIVLARTPFHIRMNPAVRRMDFLAVGTTARVIVTAW